MVYKINYRALERGGAFAQPVVLSEGDIILVPERRLFE
jgi:polysaccharide biosynthesis/export protein